MVLRAFGLALLALLLFVSPALAAGPDTAGIASIQQRRLDNGMKVIIGVDDRVPLAAVSILYRVGMALDPPDQVGMARLIGRLIPESPTRHFQLGGRRSLVDAAGLDNWDTDVSVSDDSTRIVLVVPTDALELALWMEAERMGFMADALDPKHLEWAKKRILEEEAAHGYFPRAQGRMEQLVFGRLHPYSHPVQSRDIEKITLHEVQTRIRSLYHPANVSIAITGDVDPEKTFSSIERLFGRLPSGEKVTLRAKRSAPKRAKLVADWPTRGEFLAFMWATPRWLTDDDAAMDVAARYLRRRYEALTSDASVGKVTLVRQISRRLGSYFIITGFAPENQPSAPLRELILEELQRIAKGKIDEDVLDVSRTTIIREIATTQESLRERAYFLNTFGWLNGDPNGFGRYFDGYRNTDAKQLARITKKYLARPPGVEFVANPDANAPPSGRLHSPEPTWRFKAPPPKLEVKSQDHASWYRPPRPGKLPPLTTPPVLDKRLPGGSRLLVSERRGLPVARLVTQVRWSKKPPSASVALLLGRVLVESPTQGTQTIESRLNDLGATFDYYVDLNELELDVVLPPERLPEVLDAINATLSLEDLSEEKFDEYHDLLVKAWDEASLSDRDQLLRWGRIAAYPADHPHHGVRVWEEVSGLKAITRSELQTMWQERRRLGHLSYALAGNVNAKKASDAIEKRLPRWKEGELVARQKRTFTPGTYLADAPQASGAEVGLYWPAPNWSEPNYAAALAVRWLLGTGVPKGLGTRFLENGVTHTENVYANVRTSPAGAHLLVATHVPPEQVVGATQAVLAQVERLQRGEFPWVSLAQARHEAQSWVVGQFEGTEAEATWLATLNSLGAAPNAFNELYLRAQRVDRAEVQNLAKTLSKEKLTLVVYGPADQYEKALKRLGIGSVQRISTTPPGGEQ